MSLKFLNEADLKQFSKYLFFKIGKVFVITLSFNRCCSLNVIAESPNRILNSSTKDFSNCRAHSLFLIQSSSSNKILNAQESFKKLL